MVAAKLKTMCSRGHDTTSPRAKDKFNRCLRCQKEAKANMRLERFSHIEEYQVKSKGRAKTARLKKTGQWTTKATARRSSHNRIRRERLAQNYTEKYDRNKIVYGATHCGICKKKYKKGESRSLDHIIPVSRGGPSAEWNLQSAHSRCNASKGNKILPTILTINLTGD